MMVSNRNLLFQGSIFRGYVSFREGTCSWKKSGKLTSWGWLVVYFHYWPGVSAPSKQWLALGFLNHQQYVSISWNTFSWRWSFFANDSNSSFLVLQNLPDIYSCWSERSIELALCTTSNISCSPPGQPILANCGSDRKQWIIELGSIPRASKTTLSWTGQTSYLVRFHYLSWSIQDL